MAEPAPIFALDGVLFAYPEGRPLFEDLHFALRDGESIGLMAPNGSGKTTLLRLIMGLERPLSGRVLLRGAPVADARAWRDLRRKVGVTLQAADDQLFCPTVLEDVAFGPLNLGLDRDAARDAAQEALRLLGLAGFEQRLTHKLSGGEKKMVALASVLSMHPEALLLDEPAAGLDQAAEKRLADVLKEFPAARLVISHDRAFLRETVSRALTIADGRLEPVTL